MENQQSNPTGLQKMPTNSAELWRATSEVEISCGTHSMMQVREIVSPPISSLVRSGDKTECYQFIKLMIVFLNEYFGVTWSDFQVIELAKEFYSNFYYWRSNDIKLFMSRCKSLQYGKPFGYTPATLMEWAQLYDQEWMEVSEGKTIAEHERQKYQDEKTRDIQIKQAREMDEGFSKFKSNYLSDNLNNA